MVRVHYSGILIYSRKDRFEECIRDVEACPGTEVHFSYPDSGRLIAVLETETVEGQEEVLRTVQQLSSVAAAELVYHYFGADHQENRSAAEPGTPESNPSNPSNPENRCQGACR
jgi:nitrate reductase NapAB chaperone NapD